MKKYPFLAIFLALSFVGLISARMDRFDYSAHPGGKATGADLVAIFTQFKNILVSSEFKDDLANLTDKYMSKISLNQEQYKDLKEIIELIQDFVQLDWKKVETQAKNYIQKNYEISERHFNEVEQLRKSSGMDVQDEKLEAMRAKLKQQIKSIEKGDELNKFEKLSEEFGEKLSPESLDKAFQTIQLSDYNFVSMISDVLTPSLKSAKKIIDKKINNNASEDSNE